MDNVNVIRQGFYAPDFSLPNTQGEIFHLKENLGGKFICLCFFSDGSNEKINGYLKDLNQGLPNTASGFPVRLIGICPERGSRLKSLKEKLKLSYDLLADQKMLVATRYYVVNSYSPKPSVYFSLFVIDDSGIVRHRESEIQGLSKYSPEEFRAEVAKLI